MREGEKTRIDTAKSPKRSSRAAEEGSTSASHPDNKKDVPRVRTTHDHDPRCGCGRHPAVSDQKIWAFISLLTSR
jgi:hypothetical protein